jgi:peroxiredoxin
MTQDRTASGMGIRSQRYAMIVNDGTVQFIAIDEQDLEKTSSEAILAAL